MTKGIIFDCWGTLFTNSDQPHPFSTFANKIGFELSDLYYLKLFEREIMTNSSDVSSNVTNLLARLNIEASQSLVEELTNILIGSIESQIPYADTISTLGLLAKDYKLILITNTFKEGFTRLDDDYKLHEKFDSIVLSYEEGLVKPDIKLFEKALELSQLEPCSALMVGDNYYDDILAASKAGIRGLLIDRRNRYPEVSKRKIAGLGELRRHL